MVEITAMWLNEYEPIEVADVNTIRVKKDQPTWDTLDISDLMPLPVGHLVRLFSRSIPVVIKESGQYIVNTDKLFQAYKQKGRKVSLLQDAESWRFDAPLSKVGLITPK